MSRFLLGVAFFAILPFGFVAAEDPKTDDLADYRTVGTALTARLAKAAPIALHRPGYLGVHVARDDNGNLSILHVEPNSPAARQGLQPGDIIVKLAGKPLDNADTLRDELLARSPGDKLQLDVLRGEEPLEIGVTLTAPSRPLTADAAEPGPMNPLTKKGGWDTRNANNWKKDVYHLAVVMIEYPDVKHNDKVSIKHWEESLFSKGVYTKKSVTGQTVYGSMNDYYHEISYAKFRVEGKVFEPVLVTKKRTDYAQTAKQALLIEALDKLLERDGKDALARYDGVFFMHAGGRVQGLRGGIYWPHRATVTHQGKRWAYFICPEGGGQMGNISVICHEFGHMLGLPDLYARPENPGSEGVGVWCAMSNQVGNGRPQHFSAWSKEQLGWLQPTVIAPTTPQKLILSPVYKSPKECYKVLVRADGSEYFLLENRNHTGFDTSLPAQGLLVWRVVRGRPILEESHGVTGPSGPRVYPQSVPFPSKSNDAFTPFTIPSSRAQLGGGMPVHITNIRRLPDGRITFFVGYEFF